MNMLIATDGSSTAIDAARRAVALFNGPCDVTLLTVLTSLPGENEDELDYHPSPEVRAREWEAVIGEADRDLRRTAEVLSLVHVDAQVEAGDVASTISRVARDTGADVVVVGTHMHSALRHLFRRSVAEHVVHAAPCMVLVVPSDVAAEKQSEALQR
jgi:nucleotide-binding universal stress UspA family protein